jgi:hypothetical protein
LRLDRHARLHHRHRAGQAGKEFDITQIGDRPWADEGSAADMPPDLTLRFKDRQPLAQPASRQSKGPAEITFGRQALVESWSLFGKEIPQSGKCRLFYGIDDRHGRNQFRNWVERMGLFPSKVNIESAKSR